MNLDDKIIKLSINSFRTVIYIITAICIFGVDIPYFPNSQAKNDKFGISLMDLGVLLFVFCFSLRVIRNADNKGQNMYRKLPRVVPWYKTRILKFMTLYFTGFIADEN